MSENQTVWAILWKHAAGRPRPGDPFEIEDILPDVSQALKVPEGDARRLVGGLLVELDRLPEGHRFFTREGNAVVPLAEFLRARGEVAHPVDAYPYEL